MTWLYSRRANASITAEAHATPEGLYLAARPAATAMGPFRLRFADGGAMVEVVPVRREEDHTDTVDTLKKERTAFPGEQFVNPGETLTSTVLFSLDRSVPNLIGWVVSFNVEAAGFVRRGLHWADRVFVPLSEVLLTER